MLEEPQQEGMLTAECVLRHAQAQGLQPVVDVRFSHRHLELCREKGNRRTWSGTLPACSVWRKHLKNAPRGSGRTPSKTIFSKRHSQKESSPPVIHKG